jgi:hypothetical protein
MERFDVFVVAGGGTGSAKVAALARDGDRFGVRIHEVDVDFQTVQQRARHIIDSQSGEGTKPFERVGVRVFMQEARLPRRTPCGARRRRSDRGRRRDDDRCSTRTTSVPPASS